jgi:hypothetical protein
MQTVAELLANQGRLLASFFFLRGHGDRSTIARLIPTLSHQLSLAIPATKTSIQLPIESEPHITRQSLTYQFQQLVAEPIIRSRTHWWNKRTMGRNYDVIMIDALDECDDKDVMVEFIETIMSTSDKNSTPLQLTRRCTIYRC